MDRCNDRKLFFANTVLVVVDDDESFFEVFGFELLKESREGSVDVIFRTMAKPKKNDAVV